MLESLIRFVGNILYIFSEIFFPICCGVLCFEIRNHNCRCSWRFLEIINGCLALNALGTILLNSQANNISLENAITWLASADIVCFASEAAFYIYDRYYPENQREINENEQENDIPLIIDLIDDNPPFLFDSKKLIQI